MKRQFSLVIKSPCSENWDNFIHTEDGGYCKSCEKTVLDFTGMSEKEIANFFKSKPSHVCGRFHPGQLKQYSYDPAMNFSDPGYTALFKAGIFFLFMLAFHKQGVAQGFSTSAKEYTVQTEAQKNVNTASGNSAGKIVQGVVYDEDNYPLPGVNVYLKGSSVGTITDMDGRYEFPVELSEGDVLVFSYIGFETLEYKVKNEEKLEVNMHMMYYDIMGEVSVDEVYAPKTTSFNRFWRKATNIFR